MMPRIEDRRDENQFHMGRYWGQLVVWSVILGLVLSALAVAVVAVNRLLNGTPEGHEWMLAAGGFAFTAALAWPLWKYRPDFTMGEPRTPRGNRIRLVLVAVTILGPAMVFPLISYRGPDGSPLDLFANSPLPTQVVWPMIAIWAVGIPALTFFTRRNLDDYTRAAGDFGFMVGGQLFYFAAPLWWLGWRGGLLPQPDVMILFIATLVVVNCANLWKRYNG